MNDQEVPDWLPKWAQIIWDCRAEAAFHGLDVSELQRLLKSAVRHLPSCDGCDNRGTDRCTTCAIGLVKAYARNIRDQ